MAWDWHIEASMLLRPLLLAGLLACSVRAEPDLRCPDYVADYAPMVWLHSDDPFMPSDLTAHIRHVTPMLDHEPIPNVPSLDLDNLEILNEHGDQVALTSNDDPTKFPDWLYGEAPDEEGRIHNSTACAVILVEKSEAELDAFYFYFYSYDEGANSSQVLEPFIYLLKGEEADKGMHFGNHVGDWEHNMVRFKDGKPVGIYYSQHRDGMGYKWDDSAISKTGDRPIVYSARGSHANYPAAGDQLHDIALVDYCDEGQKWDPVLSAYFYRFDPDSSTLTALIPPKEPSTPSPTANLTSFFYYNGRWGDREYPKSDPRQIIEPTFGIKRFETGPTGPRYKHLVRKGLVPDKRRRKIWKEWAAGVFMSVYPCCIKGWRKWVSIGTFVVLLSALVIAIKVGVSRCRTKKAAYSKIGEDDIQLDDWSRDEQNLFSSSDEEEDEETHR